MTAFETAQADAQSLPSKPDNATLLRLYALYKQGTQGDVTGARPGGFDFVGGAKYDAWADLQGKPSGRGPGGVRGAGRVSEGARLKVGGGGDITALSCTVVAPPAPAV